jgi:hypothetical protein
MTDTISKRLASYEEGGMSRRDLVQGLALLAAGAGTASAAIRNKVSASTCWTPTASLCNW